MLVEICANLISLFVISTPTISSPLTADFPILDLKKLSIFFLKFPFAILETFDVESFLPKSGFFNLIFLTLSKKLEAIFIFFSSVMIF